MKFLDDTVGLVRDHTRAVLAYMLVGGVLVIALLQVFRSPESANQVLGQILPVAAGVTAYYFGVKSNGTGSDRTLANKIVNAVKDRQA